jgi:hypothetical protein
MEQPTAEQALRALDPLVGTWTIEATGSDGQRWPGEGRTITGRWQLAEAGRPFEDDFDLDYRRIDG